MKPGRTAIWCITPNGRRLGEKIQEHMNCCTLFASQALCEGETASNKNHVVVFDKLSGSLKSEFRQYSNHIFIFATGIAVRMIAPLLGSKTTDPAVVVVDDAGRFAVSLVSGHIGGANELAQKTAKIIKAMPVITTATDTNALPAIDMIAKDAGLYIETPQNIKIVNMAFLTGRKVSVHDPMQIIKNILPGRFLEVSEKSGQGDCDIFCSHKIEDVSRETLVLRPGVLSVGIGCNRNTSLEDIREFMFSVFKDMQLSLSSVCRLATTDVKADEKGLLALSDEMKLPLDFYTKQELNSVTTIRNPSKMVEKHLGVKSVCEAAAILSAGRGELIVTKQKSKDVTIAVAIMK